MPERFRPYVEATEEVARRFAAAGRTLYLVGGSVRDALFPGPAGTAEPHDLDLTTDALPAEIERLVRGWADDVWTQGERFGTIGCRKGAQVYEITTHRAEVYVPESRKPEVTFGDDIVVDLSRRDFTINALALRLPDMELIDPFDGLGDLAAGRLRTPLDPEISFGDDPLRMLRAARFAARFSLEPDPALTAAVERMHGRLSIVSAERIRDELDKIVMVDVPSEALWFVVRTGLAGEFLPELPGPGPRAGPDPPPQGRAGAHARRGRQDVAEPVAAPGRALPRRRQAAHARHHRRRRELPPPRGRRARA